MNLEVHYQKARKWAAARILLVHYLILNALLKPPKLVVLTAILPSPNLDGIPFKSRLATSLVQTWHSRFQTDSSKVQESLLSQTVFPISSLCKHSWIFISSSPKTFTIFSKYRPSDIVTLLCKGYLVWGFNCFVNKVKTKCEPFFVLKFSQMLAGQRFSNPGRCSKRAVRCLK